MIEGTFLTNTEARMRPAYEAAMAKHPNKVTLHDHAEDAYGRPLYGYISVYAVNPQSDLSAFWRTYDEERLKRKLRYPGESKK